MKNIEKTTVNEFGEILSAEKTIIKSCKADEFIQVYLEDMQGIFGLTTVSEHKVLISLWSKSIYYPEGGETFGNQIFLNEKILDGICEDTSLAKNSVRNAIYSLVKKGLLIKDPKYKRSVYYLNPVYFFKGKITDRIKSINFNIKYNIR